jgi:hypothetical protein
MVFVRHGSVERLCLCDCQVTQIDSLKQQVIGSLIPSPSAGVVVDRGNRGELGPSDVWASMASDPAQRTRLIRLLTTGVRRRVMTTPSTEPFREGM